MMLRRMLPVIGMMLLSLVGGVLGGALTETWVAGRVSAAEVAGVQASEVVTTRQINLVDASGALRAILSARDERGMASLAFYDFEGQVRSVVGLENTGRPFLRFLTSDGRRRLQATLENDDALVIAGDESDRAGMFGTIGGSPVMNFGVAGANRLRLQLNRAGQPNLGLFDAEGRRGATLVLDESEAPLLTLYQQGLPRATLGVVQDATVFNMGNATQTRLVMGVNADGFPSLSFYDDEGQLFEQLPVSR